MKKKPHQYNYTELTTTFITSKAKTRNNLTVGWPDQVGVLKIKPVGYLLLRQLTLQWNIALKFGATAHMLPKWIHSLINISELQSGYFALSMSKLVKTEAGNNLHLLEHHRKPLAATSSPKKFKRLRSKKTFDRSQTHSVASFIHSL